MPVVIGAKGVERIVEIKLDASERAMFKKSVKAVEELAAVVKKVKADSKKKPAKK